ncbi:hypothetical protein [Pseudomonas mosselii]|uniref:Uncharacterized protein n=1 Tax=Pseudomonas mosselii TaxID=78327 RepID=A0AA42UTG4_9PSED|nr:hypothetical protein [Pseudomonas mosselii]MDH1632293.1 hypothetical protein [Pseudomonas mosselii]
MKSLKTTLIARHRQFSIPQRLYAAALALYGLSLVAYWAAGFPAFTITSTLACALVITGFIIWCLRFARWLRAAWEKPYAKIPIVTLHLLVLLTSTACARYAVAETLGLPPQSFDLTVAILALLFYIPSWLGVLAMIVAPLALVTLTISVIGLLLDTVWLQLSTLIGGYGYRPCVRKVLNLYLFHSTGALMGSVLLAYSYGYLTENFSPAFKTVTQIIALRSDFHKARHYPDVQPGEYVHPLENGYIAFAREQDDKSVVIGVRLQGTDVKERVVETIPSVKAALTAAVERLR